MGSRDFARREQKKPKKGAKKGPPPADILPPMPVEVEVIKKGKKVREKEEEEA